MKIKKILKLLAFFLRFTYHFSLSHFYTHPNFSHIIEKFIVSAFSFALISMVYYLLSLVDKN